MRMIQSIAAFITIIFLTVTASHAVTVTGDISVSAYAWGGGPDNDPIGVPIGNPAYLTKNDSSEGRSASSSIYTSYSSDTNLTISGTFHIAAERTVEFDPTLVGAGATLNYAFLAFSIEYTTDFSLQGSHTFPALDGYDFFRFDIINVTGGNADTIYSFNSTTDGTSPLFSTILSPGDYELRPVANLADTVEDMGSFDRSANFALTASFSAIPEPSTTVLLIGGGVVAFAPLRRRRNNVEQGAAANP